MSSMIVKLKKNSVVLDVTARSDMALEVWTVERKADLFREVFGRDVRVKVRESDRAAAE